MPLQPNVTPGDEDSRLPDPIYLVKLEIQIFTGNLIFKLWPNFFFFFFFYVWTK